MRNRVLGKTYKDGEIICREGDSGQDMFVIQSGQAAVIKQTREGEVTMAILKAGDIFGEMALFDRMPRSATVKASGTARILTIDKKGFLSKVCEDPSLAFQILESMSQRIRELTQELANYK